MSNDSIISNPEDYSQDLSNLILDLLDVIETTQPAIDVACVALGKTFVATFASILSGLSPDGKIDADHARTGLELFFEGVREDLNTVLENPTFKQD